MTWADYYERYDNWQESTQYSRLASVTDFGPETSPAHEIADCVQYVSEQAAVCIMRKALAAGVKFAPADVVEIIDTGVIDDDAMIKKLIESADGSFTGEQLAELLDLVFDDEPVLAQIEQACSDGASHFSEKALLELMDSVMDDDLMEKLLLSCDTKFSEEGLNQLCDHGVDEEVIRAVSIRSGIPYQDPDEADDFDTEDAAPKEPAEQPPKKTGFFGALAAAFAASPKKQPLQAGRCTGDCAHCPPHYGYRYGRWYYGHGHDWGCEFCGNGGCNGKCNRD